jgi:hypothetical protein
MSRVFVSKSGSRPVPQNAALERHTQRFLELRRGLEQIDCFCKGTVLKRMMKCGKAQCACASDATKRHGPYFELTYKANGKTVHVKTLTRSRSAVPEGGSAIPQVENPTEAPRQTLENHAASQGTRLNWQNPNAGIETKTGVILISPA